MQMFKLGNHQINDYRIQKHTFISSGCTELSMALSSIFPWLYESSRQTNNNDFNKFQSKMSNQGTKMMWVFFSFKISNYGIDCCAQVIYVHFMYTCIFLGIAKKDCVYFLIIVKHKQEI